MHPSIHAKTQPDKIAYVMSDSGKALTFAELDERSNRGAQLLRAHGLKPGDHIALMMENCLEFFEICWAAQRAGLYYTAISRFLKPAEISYIIADSGAQILVLSAAALQTLSEGDPADFPAGADIYVTGAAPSGHASWRDALAAQPATPITDETAGMDMLYSSGTTGRPKGVLQPFKTQPIDTLHPLMKVLCVNKMGMDASSTYLSPAPLYHAAPLRFTMTAAALGATTVVMEKFDAETFLALIERHHATHAQLVPTMFVRMLKLPEEVRNKYDISSLRAAVHAAAPCPPDIKEAMINWWGPILIEYYAGTEGNGVTLIDSTEWLTHRGSVGRSLAGDLKIIDDDTGNLQPAGRIGSVYFANGPAFAYHNSPQLTRRAHNSEGWSTLGYVGYLDGEGFLYLTDRKAYMIISGGVNIYPQETEDVLIGHPDVADVAVFGIPDPDLGESVKAIVQPTDMAKATEALAAELAAYCRARLSPLKCPKSIDFEPELPRTPTGKLLKRLLRDRYWAK
jgi:fatty-acyl-CoA synthase